VRGIESAFWGVLGKDPELKQGKNGKSFANFMEFQSRSRKGRKVKVLLSLATFQALSERRRRH